MSVQYVRGVSRAMIAVGVVLVSVALVLYVTAPEELPFASDGWFESVEARNARTTPAMFLGMFGAFLTIGGLGLTRRGRAIANALHAEQAEAFTRGAVAGLQDPAARLARLDELRDRGAITDDEYRDKRAEIVAQL